jgi:acetylornithine aminotransferase
MCFCPVAGIATCCLGHAHEGLANAIQSQINTVHHVSNLYYIPGQGKLAAWLVKNSPADRVFFCNSGAEANEGAIKLARKHAHTKRGIDEPVIITALSSFHGRTLATITATGQPKYQKNFGPLVPGFEYVPYNDVAALKAMVAKINAGPSLLDRLQFWKPKPKRGVAAILLESLQGEGGVRPGHADFFQAARELCDETGALLMCDEVQTGMGRSGKMWGFEHHGIEPDVFTLAKALGGGGQCRAGLCTFTAVSAFAAVTAVETSDPSLVPAYSRRIIRSMPPK